MSGAENTRPRTSLRFALALAIPLVALVMWQMYRAQPTVSAAALPRGPAQPLPSISTQVEALADELMDVPLTGDLVGTLHFAVGTTTLPPDVDDQIEKVRQALMAAPALKVMLSGFHDASGDAGLNATLALNRAVAARAALRAAGVDPARIRLRKPEQTLADGTPAEARRVEMRLVR